MGHTIKQREGQRRLKAWLERSKLSQRAAAKLLGMHWTFLSQICRGERSPALATAVRLYRATGIPVEAWLPTDVADERPPVAATRRKTA